MTLSGEPEQVHMQNGTIGMHMTVIRMWLNPRPQNITKKYTRVATTQEMWVRPS